MRISDWSSDVCSSDLQGSDAVGEGAQEDHRYPFAGQPNARVRVGVVPADGSGAAAPRWLDLDATDIGEDRYVARVTWVADGMLVVQLQSRDQTRLDVVRYDVASHGADVPGTLLWSERSDVWINLDRKSPRLNSRHSCATRIPS